MYGFDGGKLVKGRKRHLVVDTQGLLLGVVVTEANTQDRLGGVAVLMEEASESPSSVTLGKFDEFTPFQPTKNQGFTPL